MAENQANTSKNQSIEIDYQGWSDKTANLVNKSKKIEEIKSKILSNIESNIEFYSAKGRSLKAQVRILKDIDDYTTIILRCGTFPIWKNTVLKDKYSPMTLLNDLKNKVNADFFKKEIESYLNRRTKANDSKSRTVKRSTKKTSKAKPKKSENNSAE